MAGNVLVKSTGKYLKYSDDHFQGYWIQLCSLVRKQEEADDLLDGFLKNPLEDLVDAWKIMMTVKGLYLFAKR